MQESTMVTGSNNSVGIVGGGIQGCCMALLFKKMGYQVTILDQADDLMARASANQEGKIHMGFIYSNDKSCKTGFKLMNDSLHFAHYLEYLLDDIVPWTELKSKKFVYLVPSDSINSVDHIQEYFDKLQDEYMKILSDKPQLSYLGTKPQTIFHSVNHSEFAGTLHGTHCFQTEEVAVSQNVLKKIILNRLEKTGVKKILNTKVNQIIKQAPYRYEVKTNVHTHTFDFLVNCSWENQHILDHQLGIAVRKETNLRLKFGILSSYLAELEDMPSISMISGQYGDFVNFPNRNDRKMYFSWYPVSRYGMLVDQPIPNAWESMCNNQFPDDLFQDQISRQLDVFQNLFAREFRFISPTLVAGIIVAKGIQDIDDQQSELHQRNQNSIYYSEGYLSVSTGKYTSAPYNTLLASQIIQ